MAKDRPPSFQFYPRDFLVDTLHLTDRQYRRYHVGLCRSWDSGGYGVGLKSEWLTWMGYSDPVEWDADREAIVPLFMESPDGKHWIQKRMARERMEQSLRHQRLTSRPQNRQGGRPVTSPSPHRDPTVEPLAFASAIESESKDLVSEADLRGEESLAEWFKGFDSWWEAYPRKVAKAAARAAYGKIRPRTDQTYTLLFEGLELHRRTQWQNREDDTIPHASTWLNQRRYTDAEPTAPTDDED